MRYIAKKVKNKHEVTGIQTYKDINDNDVDVKVGSKLYEKKELEKIIDAYKLELEGVKEKYNNDIKDMEAMLEAISNAN